MKSIKVGDTSLLISYEDDPARADPSALFRPSPEREAELAAMPYKQYLNTPEWKERRRIEINAADRRCSRCRRRYGPSRLHLHHLTYERRGHEHPDDLVVLCEGCHRDQHGIAA